MTVMSKSYLRGIFWILAAYRSFKNQTERIQDHPSSHVQKQRWGTSLNKNFELIAFHPMLKPLNKSLIAESITSALRR